MTERLQYLKSKLRNSNFGCRVSNFAAVFALGALGLFLLAVGWLTASAEVVAHPFRGEALAVSVPQAKEDKPPEKPEPRDFVGTWKASFQGKTFAVLTLKMADGKLAGTFSSGEVDLADDGEVSAVNREPGEPRAIFDIKLAEQILSFKDKDGEDVDSLEMTLTGADRAELKFILTDPLPEGMPMPKPFRMTRAEKLPRISRALAG